MTEKYIPPEPFRDNRPKILFLPASEQGLVMELFRNMDVFGFRSRSSYEFRKGSFGYDQEKRLTKYVARNMIETVTPDIEVIEDPLEGKRGPNLLSQTPKSKGNEPIPLVVGVFTKFPQELKEPFFGISRILGAPLRGVHRAYREVPAPGYFGTVMDQLSLRIVFSDEVKRQWESVYPQEEFKVVPMEDPAFGAAVFAKYLEEIMENRGPQVWQKKQPRSWFGRNIRSVVSRKV